VVEQSCEVTIGSHPRWESEVFEYFRTPEYDPDKAGPILGAPGPRPLVKPFSRSPVCLL
jgi:hypothetical protein